MSQFITTAIIFEIYSSKIVKNPLSVFEGSIEILRYAILKRLNTMAGENFMMLNFAQSEAHSLTLPLLPQY